MRAALRCLLFCIAMGSHTTWAESAEPDVQAQIDAARSREDADYATQEAACYTRFAVSDCLHTLQSAHRARLAAMKRQEATLHDQTRQQALQDAPPRAMAAPEPDGNGRVEAMQQAQRDKQAAHAAQAASQPSRQAAVGPAMTPAQERENRARYARKQADAEARRKAMDTRLSQRQGAAAVPLPQPD